MSDRLAAAWPAPFNVSSKNQPQRNRGKNKRDETERNENEFNYPRAIRLHRPMASGAGL